MYGTEHDFLYLFQSGLFFDSHISTGRLESGHNIPQNGIVQEQNFYEPRDPPGDPNGTHVWTTMDRLAIRKK